MAHYFLPVDIPIYEYNYMKKKNKKLFVHSLLENDSLKRKVSFYIPLRTLDLMLQYNRKPIIRIASIITNVLIENYDEYKNTSHADLEKRLYEPSK